MTTCWGAFKHLLAAEPFFQAAPCVTSKCQIDKSCRGRRPVHSAPAPSPVHSLTPRTTPLRPHSWESLQTREGTCLESLCSWAAKPDWTLGLPGQGPWVWCVVCAHRGCLSPVHGCGRPGRGPGPGLVRDGWHSVLQVSASLLRPQAPLPGPARPSDLPTPTLGTDLPFPKS